jgi:hypothetical protein
LTSTNCVSTAAQENGQQTQAGHCHPAIARQLLKKTPTRIASDQCRPQSFADTQERSTRVVSRRSTDLTFYE